MAFVPDPLPPRTPRSLLLAELYDLLAPAERALGQLDGIAGDISFARLLWAPLMQREAILSSRIENTIATAREVALYEAGQAPSRQDTVEVANYRVALAHGLASKLPMCMRLVREMHEILLRNVRGHDQRPGEVRTLQNWIGSDPSRFASARFVPPPPGEPLLTCLRDLERFWNNGDHGLPPLLAIAAAHYQFEAIHPFSDGNGRLGRVLIALSLCRLGSLDKPLVYVSGYFERFDRQYRDLLLRVSTHGDWIAWCAFFLQAVVEEAREAIDRIHQIRAEYERVRQTLASSNAPARILVLVDRLLEQPAISVSQAGSLLEVTPPTAWAYIQRLERIGFLTEMTGGSYGRIWAATPILDIIEAPVTRHPPEALPPPPTSSPDHAPPSPGPAPSPP